MRTDPIQLLILSEQADQYRELLGAEDCDGLVISCCQSVAAALECCEATEVLFGDPDLCVPVLEHMPRLQWLQSTWAGVTPLLNADRRDYRLTNIKGVFGALMSEYVFAWLLAHERQLPEHLAATGQRRWNPLQPGTLRGKTLGLLGLGSIGSHLLDTARQFSMRVLGCSRTASSDLRLDGHYLPQQLEQMVTGVDYLVATLPSTPETVNLIDRRVLAAIKPGALLINAGRGDLLDEQALVAALSSGHLGGAVLDVFRQEPLAPDHPYWTAPNLVVTAHTAAPSLAQDILPVLLDNLDRYRRGQALRYLIDFERGY